MSVEYKRVLLTELHEDPANARVHPDENLADIRASLREFGQVEPLVVQKASGKVIGGNGRLKVMRELGWTECDVAYVEFDNMKSTALGIALNRAGERATWDVETLEKLMAEIGDVDVELAQSFKELEESVGIEEPIGEADAEPQIDRAAELQKKWQTAQGQLWLIGEHRLLCGDSTKREDVERVMGGERAGLCFTSPPYNAGDNTLGGNKAMVESKYLANDDDREPVDWLNLMRAFTANALDFAELVCINVQMLSRTKTLIIDWLKCFQENVAECAIWRKTNSQPAMAERVLNSSFEFLWFLKRDNPTRTITCGDFRGTNNNVHEGPGASGDNAVSDIHAATMPLHLPTWILGDVCNKAELVYEPFAGSGTTLVAAENLHRRCYGMEISPAYCAVVLERMKMAFPQLEIRQA